MSSSTPDSEQELTDEKIAELFNTVMLAKGMPDKYFLTADSSYVRFFRKAVEADRLRTAKEARIDELNNLVYDDNYKGGIATDIGKVRQSIAVRIATLQENTDEA